ASRIISIALPLITFPPINSLPPQFILSSEYVDFLQKKDSLYILPFIASFPMRKAWVTKAGRNA
ncbi:MAG TPA: hypothetical protein VGB30_11310, partial [bacterium]